MKNRRQMLHAVGALTLALLCGYVAAFGESDEQRRQRLKQCRAWLKAANEFHAAGAGSDALLVLDSALECDAKNADAYYLKSIILLESGDTANARETLTSGVGAAPLSTRLKLQLARLFLATDAVASADSLIDATLVYKPREPLALYLKGLVLLSTGDSASASARLESALEIALKINGR